MKKIRKMMTLVIALAMVLAMSATAFAGTITIDRDDSWDSSAEAKSATYTYYHIFDAEITTAGAVDHDTGALTEQGAQDGNVVYTISGTNAAAKVAALPNIFEANLAADGKYYITLANSNTGAAAIVAALKEMVENEDNASLFPGTAVTSDTNPVTLNVGDDGYYLILASNGKDAVVQTIGSVNIKEKNDYPTVTKEQKKAADSFYTEAEIPAEIGTYVDFKVTVHIPADATKAIAVVDKMTDGLEYDSTTGLTLNPNVAYTALTNTDAEYDSDADWQIKIADSVVQANRNSDIVITYRALVTSDALTDTGRENEVTLSYDNKNYVLKDNTEYTTYFGGIEKVDGANHNTKLEGVKFTVSVGDDDFNVTPVLDTDDETVLYYIPGGSSNEVITGEDGKIIIRGLDNTKTYTLTETETNAGYNLLETPQNLTLAEDTGTAYTTATYTQIENNKGSVLPSTGGIGTTIFYILGSILVIGGGILMISRKRLQK